MILETELLNKHFEKRKLKKDFREININLKLSLNVFLYNAVIHQVNIAIKSKVKSISRRHQKKLIKLHRKKFLKISTWRSIPYTIFLYTSYLRKNIKLCIWVRLSCTIKDKQSSKQNLKNFIKAHYIITYSWWSTRSVKNKNTEHLSQLQYNRIDVPYRYRQIIRNLSNNEKIKVLKQDKGRGVVIMDTSQYLKKCLNMLNSDHWEQFWEKAVLKI